MSVPWHDVCEASVLSSTAALLRTFATWIYFRGHADTNDVKVKAGLENKSMSQNFSMNTCTTRGMLVYAKSAKSANV